MRCTEELLMSPLVILLVIAAAAAQSRPASSRAGAAPLQDPSPCSDPLLKVCSVSATLQCQNHYVRMQAVAQHSQSIGAVFQIQVGSRSANLELGSSALELDLEGRRDDNAINLQLQLPGESVALYDHQIGAPVKCDCVYCRAARICVAKAGRDRCAYIRGAVDNR